LLSQQRTRSGATSEFCDSNKAPADLNQGSDASGASGTTGAQLPSSGAF